MLCGHCRFELLFSLRWNCQLLSQLIPPTYRKLSDTVITNNQLNLRQPDINQQHTNTDAKTQRYTCEESISSESNLCADNFI